MSAVERAAEVLALSHRCADPEPQDRYPRKPCAVCIDQADALWTSGLLADTT